VAREGELVAASFRVIATPGHTLGHTSLLRDVDGLFFTSDAFGVLLRRVRLECTRLPVRTPRKQSAAQKLLAEEFDVVVRSHGEPLYGGRTSGYRKRSPATTATYSKENSGERILKSTFERGTLYGEVILTREIDAF
jgi:glyoxylase-like metal-dependent hydrolase (beta-lactamase superfamily II)